MDIEKLLIEYTDNPENMLNIREELLLVLSKNNPFTIYSEENPFTAGDISLKTITDLIIENTEFTAIVLLLNQLKIKELETKIDKILEEK